jgi:hypothetical protein
MGIGLVLYAWIYGHMHILSCLKYIIGWPGMIVYDYQRRHPGIVRKINKTKRWFKYHFTEKDEGKWMD